jgi:protein TonB
MCFDRSGGFVSVRFLAALALSFTLHALVLVPWPHINPVTPPPPADLPLSATLLAPLLKTYEEKVDQASATAVMPPQQSVPSASTSGVSAARPQALQGRALERALAEIAREEFYPREAIERGMEGRVVLLLTLALGGEVQEVEVASSSGHRLLDDAARFAARRIGAISGARRQVLLPVEFRLE